MVASDNSETDQARAIRNGKPESATLPPPTANGQTVIETRSLTKRYERVAAVDALNLSVRAGEIFGLLGPNGAGKSTVMKMLVTLLPPTSGTATIAGMDLRTQPALVRKSIGYLPQLLSADAMLTGYENLLIFAQLYDLPRRERAARIEAALESAGLSKEAHQLVSRYSGGMIRRLEIVTAMLHRPRILFLDEPTVGLDPVARHGIWNQVRNLVAAFGTTVVLTTHLMDEAENLCSRIAMMNRGKVCALGTVDELKAGVKVERASLEDVFSFYAGSIEDTGEQFRDVANIRRSAARLG